MVQKLNDWIDLDPSYILQTRQQIRRFSPEVQGVLEVNDQTDVDILNKIYENSTEIRDLDIEYNTELHMTNDSDLFKSEESLRQIGCKISDNGIGKLNGGIKALPLMEGRHIEAFDFQASEYISGHGRSANWDELDWEKKRLVPQYWVLVEDILASQDIFENKIGFMEIASATNLRTIKATVMPPYPCNHKVPVMKGDSFGSDDYFVLTAVLNSIALDFAAKFKVQGTNLGWYIMKSLPIPDMEEETKSQLADLSKLLHSPIPVSEVKNEGLSLSFPESTTISDERKRMEIREEIDQIVARAYGVTDNEMRWILRPDTNDPRNLWRDYKERLEILDGCGKWGDLPSEELKELEAP